MGRVIRCGWEDLGMLPTRGGDRKMGWAQEHPLTHLLAGCLYHASQGWEERAR